ncbi:unnamed protein product [Aureobasidium vineae]|uniref:F-box domain-containing protein n=1 Tax=Aureobasidium vineae TaxID=2773715 RepID=A0A9N8JMD7_9PEZI|nr:unnamed protein product [Aureobasidium vineae]
MTPLDSDGDLSLSGMPAEILSAIIKLAGSGALPALRLTNKRLCAVSNDRFALQHFSERRHVASAYSMDALIEITAHPFFGKFVKTVMVSGYRPKLLTPQESSKKCLGCGQPQSQSYCTSPAVHNLTLNQVQLAEKLEEVFSNIKRSSSSVTIGVRDCREDCYGSSGYMKYDRCSEYEESELDYKKFAAIFRVRRRQRNGSYDIIGTFKAILQAAQVSGCEIEGIKLDISGGRMPRIDNIAHRKEILTILSHYVDRLPQTLNFGLSFRPEYIGDPQTIYLKYDRSGSRLGLSGYSFGWTGDNDTVPSTLAMLVRLQTYPIVSVKLENCSFNELDSLWISQSPTLRRLTLRSVALYTGFFEKNFWSSLLDRLSRKNHLQHLELHHARYMFFHQGGHSMQFQLSTGWYRLNNELQWDQPWFTLAPSGDVNESMILTDQTSISVQLKALADQVAQMEVDKVAEVKRDGFLRTNIVGICQDVPPDKNVMSEEDDRDEVQDGESGRTTDAHHRHSENDNHHELENNH